MHWLGDAAAKCDQMWRWHSQITDEENVYIIELNSSNNFGGAIEIRNVKWKISCYFYKLQGNTKEMEATKIEVWDGFLISKQTFSP